MFFSMLASIGSIIYAQEEQTIIEHRGDRYVINVSALKPDKEMTLMDVLQTCPELMSDNGKRLNSDYELRMDNVVLVMDYETLLQGLKACKISTVEVYLYTSVSTGGTGHSGTIDIYLNEQADSITSGKVMLEGSTRGNGKAYTDVTTRKGNVTVRGYALANMKYGEIVPKENNFFYSREAIENVHLNVDWNISEKDNLKVKLFQDFLDNKYKMGLEPVSTIPEREHYLGATASYTRTLNEREATLLSEYGIEYQNSRVEDSKQKDFFTYFFTETNIPCLNNDLNILAGWEIDYYNMKMVDYDRQQMMFNDLYLQLDYTKGPWVLALGDRLRFINYWHRTYNTDDTSLWRYNRIENSFLASAGFKRRGHFVQAIFSHDHFTPLINSFYNYDADTQRRFYDTSILTYKFNNAEARYTFQKAAFVVNGCLLYSWTVNNPLIKERYTGVRASVTWRKGCFRLTAGADYYHGSVDGPDYEVKKHDNFFHLRLQPTLLLMACSLRLSAQLLYNSRQDLLFDIPAHLYASVKVSKDFGSHFTLSADLHDLAGLPKMETTETERLYDQFAVTLGFTYRY